MRGASDERRKAQIASPANGRIIRGRESSDSDLGRKRCLSLGEVTARDPSAHLEQTALVLRLPADV